MPRYKVECRIGDRLITKQIECRVMTIEHNSYCFWTGEYGESNKLVWAFPIMFTIIEGLPDA